jgi:hypothetical protein
MSERERAGKRILQTRRELDEIAEQLDRLGHSLLDDNEPKVNGNLVGAAEAAALLGIPRGSFSAYCTRELVPEPIAKLACGSIWLRQDIERWWAQRSR